MSQKKILMDPGKLLPVYETLFRAIGPLHWWPGETPLEIIIGAILTQNTNWENVDKAITNLKQKNWLSLKKLLEIPETELAEAIRPSGYYNQKAKKIKIFVRYIYKSYSGSLKKMAGQPLEKLREELLDIYGIGPETADSILLYAFEKETFVVDAYTRRILIRHGWMTKEATYEDIRQFFLTHLPRDVQLYNEFHAQIVFVGKHYCKRNPECEGCPLKGYLRKDYQQSSTGEMI